jgi:hypothetical protein
MYAGSPVLNRASHSCLLVPTRTNIVHLGMALFSEARRLGHREVTLVAHKLDWFCHGPILIF